MGAEDPRVKCQHSRPVSNHPGTMVVGAGTVPGIMPGLYIPAISTSYNFKIAEKSWSAGPGKVTASFTCTLRGTFSDGSTRTRVTMSPGKFELRESWIRWGDYEFRTRQNLSPKEASLGAELVINLHVGDLRIPLVIGASIDLKKFFPSAKIRVDSPELDVARLLKTGGLLKSIASGQGAGVKIGPWDFAGTIRVSGVVEFAPDLAMVAKNAAYRVAVRGSQAITRVLFANLPAAVTYTAIVLAAVAVSIVHAGIGLYVIAYEHRKGNASAIGFSFAAGYAEMLANLTEPDDSLRRADSKPGIGRLLDKDWESDFDTAALQYLQNVSVPADLQLLIEAKSQITDCGRAAAVQDVVQWVQENGVAGSGWDILQKYFIEKAGSTIWQRKVKFLDILHQQVADSGKIRIDFPTRPAPKPAPPKPAVRLPPDGLPDPPDISNL